MGALPSLQLDPVHPASQQQTAAKTRQRRPGEDGAGWGRGAGGAGQSSFPRAHSLSVHSPCWLQLEGLQSSLSQAAPRQKCPVHWQYPTMQVPWPLQSGSWQQGSCMHTTVDTWRGQRHMLSWLRGDTACEERHSASHSQLTLMPPAAAKGCLSPFYSFFYRLSGFHRFFPPPHNAFNPRAFAHAVLSAQKTLSPLLCHLLILQISAYASLGSERSFLTNQAPFIGLGSGGTL